jgi:hypothetical protein
MNQNTNSLKTVVIIVLVLVVGSFIYTNYANRGVDQSGRIITRPTQTKMMVDCRDGGLHNGCPCTIVAEDGTSTPGTFSGDGINAECVPNGTAVGGGAGVQIKNTYTQ